MRIAILSDIHGNLAALDAVLADIARRSADMTVNLGDILSGPLQPAETADRLMDLNLPTIRGNHERQLLTQTPDCMGASDAFTYARLTPRHLDWMRHLPETLRLTEEVFLCHGTPGSDVEYFLETVEPAGARAATDSEVETRAQGITAAVILCGHTHIPRARRLGDGRLVVNPGSVGLPAYEDDRPHPHKMETGSPHARYAIIERGQDSVWSAELLSVAYDWDTAARLAAGRGREDWAVALRTGRMNRRHSGVLGDAISP